MAADEDIETGNAATTWKATDVKLDSEDRDDNDVRLKSLGTLNCHYGTIYTSPPGVIMGPLPLPSQVTGPLPSSGRSSALTPPSGTTKRSLCRGWWW